jgi:hypothetical protein
MLDMDQTQLMQFITDQAQLNTRFGGPLFSILRNTYADTSSEAVRTDILQFLKSYLNYSSTSHIERNLIRNLTRMADAMPERWSAQLRDLTAQLKNGIAAQDRTGNLTLLRHSILPLMSDYVTSTHDMGLPRGLLSLLTLDLARYENGSVDNLLQNFHQLSGYGTLKNKLGVIDDNSLLRLLDSQKPAQSSHANQFFTHLANSADMALRGTGNADTQQIAQQLVSATLVNESVYLPLNHFIIPLSWNGRMLFSELWVDPNSEQSSNAASKGNAFKLLFKMDVQGLGLFDVVLTSQQRQVELSVACPEQVSVFSKEIGQAMNQILTQNGFTPTNIQIRKMERPVTLTEVFPNIFEGKNSINVKV